MAKVESGAYQLIPPGKIKCYLTGVLRKDTGEENVRQRWLRSLVEEYGYGREDIGVEATITMGRAHKRADIVIYRQGAPHAQDNIEIVVEAKRESTLITDQANGVGQLHSYMAACATCQFGLWVGGERAAYEKTKEGIERIHDIPRYGSLDYAAPTRSDLARSHELKSVFRRCHNYIYANAGLQKAEAFHELLKLIFCKTYDEEESAAPQFVVGPREHKNTSGQRRLLEDRLTPLFKSVMRRYPFIFDEKQESLRLEADVAAYVVSELQFTSLMNTETDVKGEAYEELVGANLRGDRGEFFTPRNVCDMAVKMAMALHDRQELTSLKVLDCCCGTGGFLVSWLNNLHERLLEQERKRRGGRGSAEERARRRAKDVCTQNLYGLDINPELVKTCQMNLVLHGDGATNVHRVNSVQTPGEWSDEAQVSVPYGKVDVVLTNPPFGGRAKVMDQHVLGSYELPSWNREKALTSMPSERLFIEAAMRFLKPGGFLLIVLPDGILNNRNAKEIRSWLLSRARLVAVVDLPSTTFAASKGLSNPSLVIAQRYSAEELERFERKRPDSYEVFMATPQTAGVNKRAKTIYLRHPDGQEKANEDGDRIRDDEIATVAASFAKWVESSV